METAQVLTRPFCLLELLTAIEAGVPIIGLCLTGNSASTKCYDFQEAGSDKVTSATRCKATTPPFFIRLLKPEHSAKTFGRILTKGGQLSGAARL